MKTAEPNNLIDVEAWTTTDEDSDNHGHELIIPGNVTDLDRETAMEFFGCAPEALKHEPRKMTEEELNKVAEASEYM